MNDIIVNLSDIWQHEISEAMQDFIGDNGNVFTDEYTAVSIEKECLETAVWRFENSGGLEIPKIDFYEMILDLAQLYKLI